MRTMAHAPSTAPHSGVREMTRVDASTRRFRLVLLLCGALSPMVYVATDILAANRYVGYSYTDQAVSELFAIDAPTSSLVVPLFTLSSMLLLLFGLGVWVTADGRRVRQGLAVMFMASAVDAMVLWSFFPMHMRGLERTTTDTMHLALATNPFVLASFVLGAIAYGKWFRVYTFITIAGLLALAFYGFSFASAVATNAPTPWMGLSERLAQYGGGLWQAILALLLTKEQLRSARGLPGSGR